MKKTTILGLVILVSGCATLLERINYGHVIQMKQDAQIVAEIMGNDHE